MKLYLLAVALICFGSEAIAGIPNNSAPATVQAGSIDTSKLNTDAVTAAKIIAGAIETKHLSSGIGINAAGIKATSLDFPVNAQPCISNTSYGGTKLCFTNTGVLQLSPGVNTETEVGPSFSGSSGVQASLITRPTIAQSGSAAYTAIGANVTESSLGSGNKRLLDLQVNGTSIVTVTSTGALTLVGDGGTITSASSITTTGAFFGDGSHLTGISASVIPNTVTSSETFTAGLSVSSSAFWVGGSGYSFNVGNGTATISGGNLSVPQQAGVSVNTLSPTSFNVPSGQLVRTYWSSASNNKAFNHQNMWIAAASDTLRIPIAGVYEAACCIGWSTGADGAQLRVRINVGGTLQAEAKQTENTGSNQQICARKYMSLAAADALTCDVYKDAGSAQTITASDGTTSWFEAYLQ